MPLTRVTSQLISIPSNYPLTGSLSGTASYAITASYAANAGSGGGTTLTTGSTYSITSSWATTSSNIIGGTSNYIPLWSTNTSLGNSVLYQSSSNIGIGTTSPSYKLDINGIIAVSNSPFADKTGNYNRIYNPSGDGCIYLGNVSDPGNYYDNTNHYFRNRGNTTTYVTINSNGNVGIGTTSPASILHLQSSAATTLLRIDNTNNANDAAILLTDSTNPTGEGFRITYDSSVGDTYFNNIFTSSIQAFNFQKGNFGSGTSLLTILNSGNVGIGTTSPNAKLHLSSTGGISAPILRISGTATDTYNWASAVLYSNLTSSATAAHVIGKSETNYNSAYFGYKHSSDGSVNNAISFGFYAANDLVNILVNGNFGIGTTSPAYKLDVNGSASFADNVIITKNQNALTRLIVSNTTSNSNSYVETAFVNDVSSGAGAVGRYGSTTTTYKIVTSNNQYLYNGPTAGDIAILNDFASGSIKMSAGGNSNVQFIISSSGNVGIGTTSPSAKLHVNGNISGSSFTGSVFGTSSWANNATTASFSLNGGGGGTTLTTGSTYPITSSWATNATTASYALNSSGGGGSISYITGSPVVGQYIVVSGSSTTQYTLTQSVSNPEHLLVSVNGVVQNYSSSYTVTGSTINFYQPYSDGDEIDVRFLNGGTTVQTGSIAGQTILYNFSSSQESTLTGLNLTGNKWGVNVIEEWNSASIVGDEYYNSCSLLMHFSGSNGSTTFIDNSPRTKTFTVNGNSQISTAQSKFGSSSLLLDGTGDYLTFPANSEFAFGTGNFTIECWIYFAAGSTYRGIFSTRATNLTSVTTNGSFGVNAENGIFLWTNTFIINYTTNIGTNQWVHVALCRNGSSLKAFANGTEVGSVTYTDNLTGNLATIGANGDGSEAFNGYIDELRITKGVARYTGSFVTQSTAFLDSQNLNQLQTKYVGLVGGLNDSTVDYGVEKLSDSSLKIRKMTASGQPLSGSGALSASVDRVYVNVLNYDNVSISSSISNAVTASFAVTASYALTNITECVHLASTVAYTLPNANIVIVPFNTALILQNITINATASTVSGIEAYHWRHSTTGIFRLVYQVRANADSWNMISVCKNNNTALPVGNGYRSGVPSGGAWGILFECLYRVTDKSDRFGLFHWSNDTTGTQLAHAGANPPNTFFVTPDVGTAPTTGYYNSITITKV